MRRYINEIDGKILKVVYNQEELDEMKEFAKACNKMEFEKRKLECKIREDLKGYVIGELEDVEINYSVLKDEFYVSYKDNEYEIRTKKFLFKRIKDFLWK